MKCLSCDKTFKKPPYLKIHKESMHEGKKHPCPICGIAYSSQNYLYNHMKLVHDGIKPHVRTICDSCFAFKTGLKKHIESVHKKLKPFKCTVCD